MLLQFSVENYRSFSERETLSLVAGASASRRLQHSFETGNSFAPFALRSICLLGPNGAGKTGLIKAMEFFRSMVLNSATLSNAGDPIDVKPFQLSKKWRNSPSEFEVVFVHDGSLYQYGFAATDQMVVEEWLSARSNTPRSKLRDVFHRIYDSESARYLWEVNDSFLAGEKELWKDSTRDNALFLSTAVNLNAKDLMPVFNWIRRYFRTITSPERLVNSFSAKLLIGGDRSSDILRFIQSNDLSISRIVSERAEFEIGKELSEVFRKDVLEKVRQNAAKNEMFNVKTVHMDEDGKEVEFPLDMESSGTQVLFGLSGPLVDVLENGYTLCVDELHNSLHPKALKHIVDIFHSKASNPNGAQLLFTSHETSILANKTMHRDQIWFVEKRENGSSKLTPLSDFKVDAFEAFERSYLAGRYGALPNIQEFEYGREE